MCQSISNKIYLLIFLLISISLIIGNTFLIKSVIQSTCTVKQLTYRNCYESLGKIYMEQYFVSDNNKTGFVLCGPVINCMTSPCYEDIVIDKNYWCIPYNNFYRIVHYGYFGLDIFGIIVIFGLLIISLIFIAIIIFNICNDMKNHNYSYINKQIVSEMDNEMLL